jgi:hypothetical protein
MVFGPGILNSDPARLTLSAIDKGGEQLGRKGNAFEAEMLSFFEKQGYDAKSLKFKIGNEEFQYDVIVPWDDYVFIPGVQEPDVVRAQSDGGILFYDRNGVCGQAGHPAGRSNGQPCGCRSRTNRNKRC